MGEEQKGGMMKMRGGHRLSGGVKRRVKEVSSGSSYPEGAFDSLRLTDSPVWVMIHPQQMYEQTVYDRDLKAVVEVARVWYQSEQHWVSSLNFGKGAPIACTSGPEKNGECLGCDIDSLYWQWYRSYTDAKGTKPGVRSPAGRTTRYTMSVVVAEDFYKVPLMRDGKQRKTKAGKPIYNDVPGPQLPRKERSGESTFGKKMHWGFGYQHRVQLEDIDEQLRSSCGSCAKPLVVTGIVCPECGTVQDFEDVEDSWTEHKQIREEEHKCDACNYFGNFNLDYSCSNDECDDPTEGGILSFELQLRVRSSSDNKMDLMLEGFRLPTDSDRMMELLANPLDVAAIKAPQPLSKQHEDRLKELIVSWREKVSGEEQGVPYSEAGGEEIFGEDDEDDE